MSVYYVASTIYIEQTVLSLTCTLCVCNVAVATFFADHKRQCIMFDVVCNDRDYR